MSQPPEGYQPPQQQPAAPRKGGALDIGFTRFLSLSMVSVLWVVALIVSGLVIVVGTLIGLFTMTDSVGRGLLTILGSIIGGVLGAILSRLFLEGVAILFRIGNNTSDIARNTGR